MSEVPKDLICEGCALYNSRGPSNVLTCTKPSHTKPKWRDAIKAAENWVPGLSIAGLGVNLSLTHWIGPTMPVLKAKDAKRTTTATPNACRAGACAHCAHGAPRV